MFARSAAGICRLLRYITHVIPSWPYVIPFMNIHDHAGDDGGSFWLQRHFGPSWGKINAVSLAHVATIL